MTVHPRRPPRVMAGSGLYGDSLDVMTGTSVRSSDSTLSVATVPTAGALGKVVGLRRTNGSPVSIPRRPVVPATSTGTRRIFVTRVNAVMAAAGGSAPPSSVPEGEEDPEHPAST